MLASMLSQVLASNAAGLGRHELAEDLWARQAEMVGHGPIPEGLEPEGAVDAVVRAAQGRRVVFVNEAHHMGRHREFVRRLLAPMRAAGFTHLACEGFANSAEEDFEVDASRLGYATTSTGQYVRDPLFGELVRTAVSLGFELVAYETTDIRPPGGETAAQSVNRRDADQAATLVSVLEEDPGARMLVYCGFAHLTENEVEIGGEAVNWVASRVASALSIDPLTVSQTGFLPGVPAGALAGGPRYEPFVLRGDAGLWTSEPNRHDIEVLHPEVPPRDGRPGWLAADRRPVHIAAPDGVTAVVARRVGEGADAVPSDVDYLGGTRRRATLVLLPGEYEIWGVDADGTAALLRVERVG